MKIRQILLLPFVPLYGLVIRFWLWLYSSGINGKTKFSLPIIAVGNLQVGGTGKTPLVAWLAEELSTRYQVGILSRGYKRLTYGFKMAESSDTYRQIGDEPAWFRRKIPQAALAVAENRVEGIPYLLGHRPDVNLVILDDAYQQLGLMPTVNILLTPYHRPYTNDMLLPAGRLREPKSGQSRADIIIVSNCPLHLLNAPDEVQANLNIQLQAHQHLFLTGLKYGTPYHLFYEGDVRSFKKGEKVLLLTGIADASQLLRYLQEKGLQVFELSYNDHHRYIEGDLDQIALNASNIFGKETPFILSTEKDAMRLLPLRAEIEARKLDIYIQPLSLDWNNKEKRFLEVIQEKVNDEP